MAKRWYLRGVPAAGASQIAQHKCRLLSKCLESPNEPQHDSCQDGAERARYKRCGQPEERQVHDPHEDECCGCRACEDAKDRG